MLRIAIQKRIFPQVLQQESLLLRVAVRVAIIADVDADRHFLVRRTSPALDLGRAEPTVNQVGDHVNAAGNQEHRPPLGHLGVRVGRVGHGSNDEWRNNTVEIRNTVGDAHQGAGEILAGGQNEIGLEIECKSNRTRTKTGLRTAKDNLPAPYRRASRGIRSWRTRSDPAIVLDSK